LTFRPFAARPDTAASDVEPTGRTHDGDRYRFAGLLSSYALTRLPLIGAVLIAIAGCFAWVGGWLSPGRLDQTLIINTFEAANGVRSGFRRNHAKGVCVSGYFESSGAGAPYSRAEVFMPGRVPVFGRFALAGGMPMMPDGATAVRSMALNFTLPDGETWRTGMNDIPVFPVKDARGFYEQLAAGVPDPNTGKPDPEKMKAFLTTHPETMRAMSMIRAYQFSSGFANATYNGLNTFHLVDSAARSTPVRWSMVPVDAFAPTLSNPPDDKNYLFDDLLARIQRGPVQWHLVLSLGQPGDSIDDATIPWAAGREQIRAGTLTVTSMQTEEAGNCRDVNFDPLVLPAGISPSDDPLLSARSAAYSLSFLRRAGEAKVPSAVQIGQGP
jgi:catalase